MVRQRMSALDIKAVVDELRQSIVGLRLQNVYDLSPRVFLLKFGLGDRKLSVFIESGVRLHLTTLTRDKPKVPSQFTLKLRKHVRSWRLDAVEQLGFDRTVDFRFGTGESCHHFIIEFFAKGNFILTDGTQKILMVLRAHSEAEQPCRVNEHYPAERAQPFHACTSESLRSAMDAAEDHKTLKEVLCEVGSYGPLVVEHVLLSVGLRPSSKKAEWKSRIGDFCTMLIGAFTACNNWFEAPLRPGGFLLLPSTVTPNSTGAQNGSIASTSFASASGVTQYLEFSPVMLKQFETGDGCSLQFEPSFSGAVEKFFLPTEMDRIEQHNVKKEVTAVGKKDKSLRDHSRRIEKLRSEEELNQKKAELLQFHSAEVDEAIELIRLALSTGISWSELSNVVRQRQREGHPVANIIHQLNLQHNSVSLLLVDPDFNAAYEEDTRAADDEQGDESAVAPVVVDVEIGLSAHANARRYYDCKKASAKKLEKTIQATDKVIAGSERKGAKVAERKGPAKREIIATRPSLWFEKFYWCVSSFGHLIAAARDPTQADALWKRYLKHGDFFVHSDAEGALPCVVKNPGLTAMAVGSLEEAGSLAVCRSAAWEQKMSVSSWWVYASQVTKRGASGGPLPPGQFHIKGRKNFLQAMPLQLGCALLFSTDATHACPAEALGVDEARSGAAMDFVPAEDPSPAVSPTPTPQTRPVTQNPTLSDNDSSRGTQNEMESDSPHPAAGKKKPSVKDRRLMSLKPKSGEKKTMMGTGDSSDSPSFPSDPQPAPGATSDGSNDADESSVAHTQADSGKSAKPQPGLGLPKARRQATKLKKIARKYGEQDDEDREAAMALIGHRASKLHQSLQSALKKNRQNPLTGDDESEEEKRRSENSPDQPDQDASSKQNRVRFAPGEAAQNSAAPDPVAADHESLRERSKSFEEDDQRLTERIVAELRAELPHLTGCLTQNEVIQRCYCVLAPYSAVLHYTFKAKIIPGNEKRGAAVKAVLHHFAQAAREYDAKAVEGHGTSRVSEALSRLAQEDAAQQFVGGVKIQLIHSSGTSQETKAGGRSIAPSRSKHVDAHPQDS